MVNSVPWIIVSRKNGPAININDTMHEDFIDATVQQDAVHPALISLIGRNEKSCILREFLGDTSGSMNPCVPLEHGQVLLCKDKSRSTSKELVLYADCELFTNASLQWDIPAPQRGPRAFSNVRCSGTGKDIRDLATNITANLLVPFSNVICVFASDFHGIRASAHIVASIARASLGNDMFCKPHVVVVVNMATKGTKVESLESRLRHYIRLASNEDKESPDTKDLTDECFKSVSVLPVPRHMNIEKRAALIQEHALALNDDVSRSKVLAMEMLSYSHFRSLFASASTHVCEGASAPFSFLKHSRPHGFDVSQLTYHLRKLFSILPSEAWLWHLASPLIASSLLLATYPPGAHRFSPASAFQALYKTQILDAIREYTPHAAVHDKFIDSVATDFALLFDSLPRNGHSAAKVHLARLKELRKLIENIKTQLSCLCCSMRKPEKVLDCFHAYCDTCIRTFGIKRNADTNTYQLPQCLFCSCTQSRNFCFIPPTAGVRMLSVDGGGVRGIIPLTVLRRLEADLAYLGCPLQEHFDFVTGTSSGGLTAIGMFLMQWPAADCLQKFYTLAHETFGRGKNGPLVLGRLQSLFLAYMKDYQYKSLAIEVAFQSAFGPPPKMFNPLSSDTKVAVIAAPVKGKTTSVICNYNGKERPSDIGYNVLRSCQREHDVTIDEAARCTTAAPGFFKPQLLRHFGTFQDGALHHNNPAKIALWERKYIWPEKAEAQPDFILSIGTGLSSKQEPNRVGPFSPVKDRCLSRILEAFSWNIDADRAWKDIMNWTPTNFQARYHRINLPMENAEPSIDDIATIDSMRDKADEFLLNDPGLEAFKDNLIASMFYFQFTSVVPDEDTYKCHGIISCRVALPKVGRQNLHRILFDTGSYFLVNGTPAACFKSKMLSKPFKRTISFTVDDLEDNLYISLHCNGKPSWQLSGLPQSVRALADAQGLFAKFGRSDHRVTSGRSARLPQKRAFGTF